MSRETQRPYVPAPYRMETAAARAMIRAQPFALIVTPGQDGVTEASHTPLYFEDGTPECPTLIGHIARINPQTPDLLRGGPALAVFTGPSAYVSPRWYVEAEDVPTWVYRAVQVRGRIAPVAEGPQMLALMENIIAQSEARIGGDWQLSRIPQADVDRMMPRIVGFRLHIETVTGVSKLEQTRSAANRDAVGAALRLGEDPGGVALAPLMQARAPT
ncbi:FMN-binding negative transcriptional regulator [Pseudodonghicola flavimaris]|uniref:FMN-binding negative transcriptional regulator n=1 Tax=Pseudodonghicola flavimaris TaxID=3050036 RepID=A0ABT7F837_9RHOB|nr:FMN-binding negative transcriptional regulator [Pseudodonghicola flavimaris]MDK3020783.1 FMN-binding negative transcriptional regulator [Pseudodonghicola flavimaris]